MTEIAPYTSDLDADIRYAQLVTTKRENGSAQSLLPEAYRENPANVIIAIGLGKAIGISPAQALYDIYVVNGRPSPSANLMAALVRRAGHKLRIEGDARSCTATLIRSDDPDSPFAATWTFDQAKAAGLTSKQTWKAFPGAMLRARAISEVVRMGASESVLGMDYSAEEMRDVPPTATGQTAPALSAASFTKPAPAAPVAEQIQDAEEVPEEMALADDITGRTRGQLFAMFAQKGIGEDRQLSGVNKITGNTYHSRSLITETDALAVIEVLKGYPDATPDTPPAGVDASTGEAGDEYVDADAIQDQDEPEGWGN